MNYFLLFFSFSHFIITIIINIIIIVITVILLSLLFIICYCLFPACYFHPRYITY